MICPCCAGQPLSFAEFWTGVNAIRVQCRECGCELKANKVTWAWLLACISILVVFFILLFANIKTFIVPEEDGKLLILLVVFVCAVLSWLTGGYVAAAPDEGSDKDGTGKPADQHSFNRTHNQLACYYLRLQQAS